MSEGNLPESSFEIATVLVRDSDSGLWSMMLAIDGKVSHEMARFTDTGECVAAIPLGMKWE